MPGTQREVKPFLVLSRNVVLGIAIRFQIMPCLRVSLTPRFPPLTLENMEVRLTPDQEAFVRQAIESGRLPRAEDAVEEALSLWEERERTPGRNPGCS